MTSMMQDGTVEFKFFRPNANNVAIVGEFNAWNNDDTPMENLGDGWWSMTLDLSPGDYRFRYLADGQWHTDYAANGIEKSKWGWNSIITVPKQAAVATKKQETRLKVAA